MDLLDRLLQHDAWTTARFLDGAIDLSDAALDRCFELGHGTVRATFIHLIGNMCTWTDLMAGTPCSRPPIPAACAVKDLAELHAEVTDDLYKLAREVIDHGRLNDTFVDVLDNPPRRKSFGGGILHVATHNMHHRAQLLYMFKQLGVKNLPEGDALSWEKQHVGGWKTASMTKET